MPGSYYYLGKKIMDKLSAIRITIWITVSFDVNKQLMLVKQNLLQRLVYVTWPDKWSHNTGIQIPIVLTTRVQGLLYNIFLPYDRVPGLPFLSPLSGRVG